MPYLNCFVGSGMEFQNSSTLETGEISAPENDYRNKNGSSLFHGSTASNKEYFNIFSY